MIISGFTRDLLFDGSLYWFSESAYPHQETLYDCFHVISTEIPDPKIEQPPGIWILKKVSIVFTAE